MNNASTLIQRIQRGVTGQYFPIRTPFGERPLVYADYTASGRSLDFIERAIREQVLPYYANTHTEASLTGAQTTQLREAARTQVRHAINAGPDDAVIFCGSGATAAINRLVDLLNLRPSQAEKVSSEARHELSPAQRPVVFVGPYEHHSNELPWRESKAEVVRIPTDAGGSIDASALESALETYRDRPLRIGSFSAASNVTGIRSDVAGITGLLKVHGALAFWDYAAAGPYVGIDMNPGTHNMDAIFLSPHKFIGGPGTPGILAVKSTLLRNRVPAVVGGGTVSYVTADHHRFIDAPERREEGGTPAIVESIRAGLVFRLQQAVGTETIEAIEHRRILTALDRLSAVPGIDILGGTDAARLSILSFRLLHGERELHYGFVIALLNDLFGIQARGGCSCAGPYGHLLLGLDPARSRELEKRSAEQGHGALRPGWVRLNFNYFISENEFNYLLEAICVIARDGWRLLPHYVLDTDTGLWRYHGQSPDLPVNFESIDFLDESPESDRRAAPEPAFDTLIAEASRILAHPGATPVQHSVDEEGRGIDPDDPLRWFSIAEDIPAASTETA
ncbi:MAG: aminotransferase class V-fold PLP-dependent enzyme [Chromatocurvus sp.]